MKPVNKTAARVSGLWDKDEEKNKKKRTSVKAFKKKKQNNPEDFTICKYCECRVLKKRLRKHYAKIHGSKIMRIPAISDNKRQSKALNKTGKNTNTLVKKVCSKCSESYIGKRTYLGNPICPECKNE
jgi:hypothetical protein